jgi:hypothetical protein
MNVLKSILNGSASKFFVAIAGAAGAAARTGNFDWKTFVAGAITAALVYLVPNAGPDVTVPK